MSGITLCMGRYRNMLSTVEEAYLFWIYGNGTPMEILASHITGAQTGCGTSTTYSENTELHIIAHLPLLLTVTFSDFTMKSITLPWLLIINYVWLHPLHVWFIIELMFRDELLPFFLSFCWEKRKNEAFVFLMSQDWFFSFSNCYIFMCHLFSVFFHDFL